MKPFPLGSSSCHSVSVKVGSKLAKKKQIQEKFLIFFIDFDTLSKSQKTA
jgi:hypothetical protein